MACLYECTLSLHFFQMKSFRRRLLKATAASSFHALSSPPPTPPQLQLQPQYQQGGCDPAGEMGTIRTSPDTRGLAGFTEGRGHDDEKMNVREDADVTPSPRVVSWEEIVHALAATSSSQLSERLGERETS